MIHKNITANMALAILRKKSQPCFAPEVLLLSPSIAGFISKNPEIAP